MRHQMKNIFDLHPNYKERSDMVQSVLQGEGRAKGQISFNVSLNELKNEIVVEWVEV